MDNPKFKLIFLFTLTLTSFGYNELVYAAKKSQVGNTKPQGSIIKGQPIQIVKPDETHSRFILNEESLEALRSIESPIAVICAVGSIHTGKSFLMNQILSTNNGFEIGYTVNPGTSGIWMWSEPLVYKKTKRNAFYGFDNTNESVSVIILDTEGFHGPNVTKSYDQTLYAIASLLSTEVLFVTNKMIDSRDLEYLEELTKGANLFALRAYSKSLAKNIEANQVNDPNSYKNSTYFSDASAQIDQDPIFKKKVDSAVIIDALSPSSLTWVVQDFIQDLEGKTPLQWLDNLIDSKPRSTPRNSPSGIIEGGTISKDNSTTNQSKHSLRDMYENINCITLPAPTTYEEMQKIDLVSPEKLSTEFKTSMTQFKSKLFERTLSNVKSSGKTNSRTNKDVNLISGSDLADLLQFLVRAANENYFDDIGIFINQFLQVRADVIKNDLKRLYDSTMSAFLNGYPPPLLEEVSAYELKLYNRTISLWSQQILGDSDKDWAQKTQKTLIDLLHSGQKGYIDTAELLIKNYCKKNAELQLTKENQQVSDKKDKMPFTKQSLDQWISNQSSNAKELLQNSINQQGKPYLNTPICNEEFKNFCNEMDKIYIKLKVDNNEAIAARYDTAKKSGVQKFRELMNDKQNFMVFGTEAVEFSNIILDWKWTAFHEFDRVVGDLIVMESETSEAKNKLQRDLEAPQQEASQIWDNQCKQHCQDLISRWQNTFKNRLFTNITFPIEDEILQSNIKSLMDKTETEFRELYCVYSRVWNENFELLKEILQTLKRELEKENIEAIKFYFKEPLEVVLNSLSIDASKYSLWKSFSELAANRAKKAILQNIEPNKSPLVISDRLIEKVILHWMEKELIETYQGTIAKNFQDVIWKIGGGAFMITGLTSVLFFQYTIFGVMLFVIGIYSVLGSKVISELLRRAFQGTITYIFNLLLQWLGFEITCILILVIIIITTIYVLYYLEIISTDKRERDIPPYLKNPNYTNGFQQRPDPRIMGEAQRNTNIFQPRYH